HIASEVAAREQEPRRDPGAALRPARHRRRIEQDLPELAADHVEVGNSGQVLDPELAVGRDNELDRALDARAERERAVKVARQEQRAQERRDLVVIVPQNRAEPGLQWLGQLLAHEEAIELAGNELGRHFLLENDREDVDAVEIASAAEEALLAAV